MPLQNKTVLVTLNITQWTAQKFDPKVTAKANEDQHAKADAGRFNKHLIHKDALKRIRDITNTARAFHYANTLPWHEAQGTRILPVKMMPRYSEFMRKQRRDFDDAKRTFLSHYPDYVAKARERLGDMFTITDFPEQSDLENRFDFRTAITPVPTSGDFRVEIPASEMDAIKADLDNRLDTAKRKAYKELWSRTQSVLDGLYTTLSDENRRVYKSTVHDNIEVLLDQLRDLNFDNDEALSEVATLIDDNLTLFSPEAIKNDATFRRDALAKTDAVIRQVTALTPQ